MSNIENTKNETSTMPIDNSATQIAKLSNSHLKRLKKFYASRIKKSYDGLSTTRTERQAKRLVQKASRKRNRK